MTKKNVAITYIICLTSIFIIGTISLLIFSSSDLTSSTSYALKKGLVICGLLLIISAAFLLVGWEKRIKKANSLNYLYDNILNNTNVGLGVITANDEYEYANRQFKNLLGIDAFIIAGKKVLDIVPDSVYDFIVGFRAREIKKARTYSKTIQEGSSYIYCTIFKSVDILGRVKYVVTAQDHTALINLKNQIHQQLEEVQSHMQAKEALFANVSHELKTPLNAIIGLSHILENTELTEKQEEIVSKIMVSSDYLLGLINDVLDYSKIKRGALDLYPTSFKLTSLLDDVHNIFSPIISDKNIQWLQNYQFPNDLYVSLDRLRLEQILTNLVGNAVKFTDYGYIKLIIRVAEEHDDSLLLKFIIEDTGIGIDSKDLPKLFDEFTQVENHLTKKHQGTGLGLPICKQLIEGMGGDIWLESTRGIGSRFIFTIPTPKISGGPENTIAEDNPSLYGHGEKVLVVEDTLINYEVVEELLEAVNVSCDHAENGIEAIEKCKELPKDYYKVILMDIHMPKMDGYEASRQLKKLGVQSPILALTATNIDNRTMEKYSDIMEGFILKPFKHTQLYNALLPYFAEDPFFGRKEAIENLGNNQKLYNKHLSKFINTYKDTSDVIEKAIVEKDWLEARRVAHSVKGLSGMLGLTYLEKASKNLEDCLAERMDNPSYDNSTIEIQHCLNAFQKKLQQVVQN